MGLNYEQLDDILKYLKESNGYRNWLGYNLYIRNGQSRYSEEYKSDDIYVGLCNTLLHWKLVDYKISGHHGHTYIINPDGIELINTKKSTKDLHDYFKKREDLELKILEGTIQSHKTGEAATNLNKVQLVVTIILGLVSAFTICIQCESNKISKRNLEVMEKTYLLELNNKATIDTIVVKLNSPLKK